MLQGYEVVKWIKKNKNSFSDVALIQDKNTNEMYILKVIKGIVTPLHKVLFEREVQALSKLRICDNIVKLISYDQSEYEKFGICGYIFLENIIGKCLDEVDTLEMRNSDKYRIIEQLINAVQVAHENSIIHRDINPSNIMIYNENKIKLIDFGISKIKDMINNDTVYQFATNRYAAPEVVYHSENATEKSDIYSLGAIIYNLFTGEEPPIASEFEQKIKTSGMDVKLKEIVKKMVCADIEERYENIFEVKKDILSFLKIVLKTDKKYFIKLNSRILDYMKKVSLVSQHKVYKDIIDEDIYNDFLEAFADIEIDDNNEENYVFYGNTFSFECKYLKEKQIFLVSRVIKLYPGKREYIKKKKMRIDGNIEFCMDNIQNKNNNLELTNQIKDFKINFNSAQNIQDEYTKNFFAWHKLLELMEERCKNEALKINYSSYKREGSNLVFSIDEEQYYKLYDIGENDISFIIEKRIRGKVYPKEIGSFLKVEAEDEKYYLYLLPKDGSVKNDITKKGEIIEDYRKNLTLIKREMKAISAFNNEEYVSTANLKGIFSEVSNSSSFNRPSEIEYFNRRLDPYQKKAIEKVLNAQDISLIQGPPGTGKTNVIIEIIRQILKEGDKGEVFKKKILLVSQAHTAVDKMLEDLDECSDSSSKVIRIGRDKNLTEKVREKYAIDVVQMKWIDDVLFRCKNNFIKMLNISGINEGDFNKYYDAKQALAIKNNNDNIYLELENSVKKFEKKYSNLLLKENLNSLIIQKDWINRIKGDLEIEKYFIKNSIIVAGTCTGFISNNIISDMVFDYLIIDEAAKATFPELLISIIRAKKIILVGDHKQLPPVLDENLIKGCKEEFNENNIDANKLYTGIFYRLFNHLDNRNKQTLKTQYRMHPIIGSMVSEMFYDNEIANGVTVEERIHNIREYDNLAIVWINTSNCENKSEEELSKTYRNTLESNIVREQLKMINNYSNKDIEVGVITPYSAQKDLIRKEIKHINLQNIKGEVAVNSVDAFQGGQKDVIIYSTVRSNSNNKIGFLKSEERLNVAFSRAKKLLIIIGDIEFLEKRTIKDNRFPEVINYIKKNESTCKIIDYKNRRKL